MAELQTVNTPIHTSYDGQIIENLDLHVASGDAITVTNDNVIIRNCRIYHQEGDGISLSGASNVTIENCEIINSSPPTGNGPETSDGIININAYDSPNLTVDHVTLRDGSSGMYLLESPGATISNVEGYNFHGPFPRGQFVQFDKSGNSSLTNFYVYNDPAHSHTEDNVSAFYSPNVTISNGLIDGNNSPSGVGVMFEGDSGGGKVDHVDAVHMGNGAFSSYSKDVTFDYTRSFDNIATNQGRGLPASNALIWNVSNTGISIEHSSYTHPGNPNNIVWDRSKAVVVDIHQDSSAIPMGDPVTNDFSWDDASAGGTGTGADSSAGGTDTGAGTGAGNGTGTSAGGTGTDTGTGSGTGTGADSSAGGTDTGAGTGAGNGTGTSAGGTGTDTGTSAGGTGTDTGTGSGTGTDTGTGSGTGTGADSSAGGTDTGAGTGAGNGTGTSAGGTGTDTGTGSGTGTGTDSGSGTGTGTDSSAGGTDTGTGDTGAGTGTDTGGTGTGAGDTVPPPENVVLRGGRGNNHLDGGDGNDQLYGGRGNDILVGHAGNDVINGERGRDILMGGLGNDVINGNSDKDYLLLDGTKQDYIFAVSERGVTITNSAGEVDTVKNVEVFHFSDGTNYLVGRHGLVQTDDQSINKFLADSGVDQSYFSPVPTAGTQQQPVQAAASNPDASATNPVVPQHASSTPSASTNADNAGTDTTQTSPGTSPHSHGPFAGFVASDQLTTIFGNQAGHTQDVQKVLTNAALWNAVDAASNTPTDTDSALADLKQQLHDTFGHSGATDTVDELAALLHWTHHE